MGLFVAIGKLKKEVMQCTEAQERPEVEEVIASKRNTTEGVEVNDLSDKREWMSSFQLWSSDINFDHKKKDSVSEVQLVYIILSFINQLFLEILQTGFLIFVFLLTEKTREQSAC